MQFPRVLDEILVELREGDESSVETREEDGVCTGTWRRNIMNWLAQSEAAYCEKGPIGRRRTGARTQHCD